MEGYSYNVVRFAENAWKVVRIYAATNKEKTVVWIIQREDKTLFVVADCCNGTKHKNFENKHDVVKYVNKLRTKGEI